MFARRWVCLSLAMWSCGGPTSPSPSPPRVYSSAHFVFNYTAIDAANIADTASSLEAEYARIVSDLNSPPLPIVRVQFYTDNAAMIAATAPIAGVVPPGVSGLITGVDQIHLMSPDLPGWGGRERMLSNLVHEFAHCVTMRINATIPNRPRWLWESVAIWESRQRVDLRSLPYVVAGQLPPFSRFESFDNSYVYDLGYSIAEFIVARGGQPALRALIVTNGDTRAVLGLTLDEFEQAWGTGVFSTDSARLGTGVGR